MTNHPRKDHNARYPFQRARSQHIPR